MTINQTIAGQSIARETGATHAMGGYRVSEQVLNAVREASQRTGIDFRYMMAKAATESAFQPGARAGTSNATGLYQFINSTWLGMIKMHGERYGLGHLAEQIVQQPNGTLTVADPAVRRQILDLRNDPRLSALMAGEYALENREYIARQVGGEIGPTELYFGHFLGAGGAATFLSALRANPQQTGAALFPAAAAANGPAFYDRGGRALTLQQIYDAFEARVSRVMAMCDELPHGAEPAAGAGTGSAFGFAAAREPAAGPVITFGPQVAPPSPNASAAMMALALATPSSADLAALYGRRDALISPGAGAPAAENQRRLSLWTVVTLSSLPTPGEENPLQSDGRETGVA